MTFSLTLLATVGLSVPAHAAPDCSNTTPALDEQVTCTYSAGGFTDITVPAGADYMAIVLKGAGGGGGGVITGTGAAGGSGSQVAATIAVSSITNVRVVLGQGGAGGEGGLFSNPKGGVGGGYSALYAGLSTAAGDVLAVAGGGGGGGGSDSGISTKTGGSGSASNTAAGGDGVDPGHGAPGDGTGGTGGTGGDGGSWDSDSDGAGGSGSDVNSGDGGAGYGGGEEGAEGDDVTFLGGGGGAGGSYVRPALLYGTATYSPDGGSGGPGSNRNGSSGDNGSVVITFSADPITPTVSSAPVAQFAEFSYFLPDGRECSSISPQRVQVGTYVELPGVDANCKSMPGSVVAGWTIPVAPGFTGAGSSSLPLSPGHRVRVIESQRFTLVPFDPVLTIEYDSNIANDDACTPANLTHASENGRVGYSWVPRVDFAMART